MASLRALAIFCTALAGLSGILGAFLLLFTAPWLADIKHSPELVPALVLISPLVPLTCMQTVWLGDLQGFKDFKWRVELQLVLLPVALILLLIVVDLFFHTLGEVVVATVMYGSIGAVLSFYFFFRKMTYVQKAGPEVYEVRRWFGFAAPNFLTSIVDTVLASIDTFLLAFFVISNAALNSPTAVIVNVNLMRLLQVRILVKMRPYRWVALKPVSAELISALLTGGLLYLQRAFKAPHAQIYDLVPTVPSSMALPTPTTFDGRVLGELFVEDRRATHAPLAAESAASGGLARRKLSKLLLDVAKDQLSWEDSATARPYPLPKIFPHGM